MSLVTLTSATGSPGTTTLALRLARELARRAQPPAGAGQGDGRRLYLVDADADGGDVGLRLRLEPVPGMATLALAGRHGLDEEMLAAHAQRSHALPGVAVLPGVSGRAQAPVIESLAAPIAEVASSKEVLVVVDAGRACGSTSLSPLLERSERVIVVCRNDTPSVVHARSALIALGTHVRASCAVVAGAKESADELAAALGREVAAVLPLERYRRPDSGRHRAQLPGAGKTMADAVARLADGVTGRWTPAADATALVGEVAPAAVVAAAMAIPTRAVSS